jgi:hypothetical protein
MVVYDKQVHSAIFNENILMNNILRNVAQNVGADEKVFTIHNGINIGSAAGSETLTLPTAGSQGYVQATIPMKKNFHTIGFTDYVLQLSKVSKQYLVDVMQSEYNGAKEDMARQLSRQ